MALVLSFPLELLWRHRSVCLYCLFCFYITLVLVNRFFFLFGFTDSFLYITTIYDGSSPARALQVPTLPTPLYLLSHLCLQSTPITSWCQHPVPKLWASITLFLHLTPAPSRLQTLSVLWPQNAPSVQTSWDRPSLCPVIGAAMVTEGQQCQKWVTTFFVCSFKIWCVVNTSIDNLLLVSAGF